MSEPVLLRTILGNLALNAVQYTPRGGKILLGVRRRGDTVRVDVCDTGNGITVENIPRIFDAFTRVDTSRDDGLGIGLFIVRRALKILGYHIEVSSHPQRGSRFSISIPRA